MTLDAWPLARLPDNSRGEGTGANRGPGMDGNIPSEHLGGRVLVASDFDGTMAPIVPEPANARAEASTVKAFHRLARHPRVVLAVVSGRTHPELERLCAGFPACWRVGDHGRSVQDPRGRLLSSASMEGRDDKLDPVFFKARSIAIGWDGLSVERKDYGVALHYRNAPESSREAILDAVDSWVREAREAGLESMRGREVVEVQIPGEGKLAAIRRISKLERCDFVVFGGDDTTDIEAIRFLSESPRGCGVWVRSPERDLPEFPPEFIVDGPSGWASFLHHLADQLENHP